MPRAWRVADDGALEPAYPELSATETEFDLDDLDDQGLSRQKPIVGGRALSRRTCFSKLVEEPDLQAGLESEVENPSVAPHSARAGAKSPVLLSSRSGSSDWRTWTARCCITLGVALLMLGLFFDVHGTFDEDHVISSGVDLDEATLAQEHASTATSVALQAVAPQMLKPSPTPLAPPLTPTPLLLK